MSVRHRVALALEQADHSANYAHEVINTANNATFVFEDGRAAGMVSQMLRIIFKRKPLIHKGRKP